MCNWCWCHCSGSRYSIWLYLSLDRTILLFAWSNLCKGSHPNHCFCVWASTNSLVILHVWFPYPALLIPCRSIFLLQAVIWCYNIHSYVRSHKHVFCRCYGSADSCCYACGMPYQCHCSFCHFKEFDSVGKDKEQGCSYWFYQRYCKRKGIF